MMHPTKLPRGGVDPPTEILVPRGAAIANAAIPSRAVIPLLQHSGTPPVCLVKPGDRVGEGMLIGKAEGPRSANVHSSIPGVVTEVIEHRLPGGQACTAVVVELGGEFHTSGKPRPRREWQSFSRVELLDKVRAAGVVGMGGGLLPTHLKLAVAPGSSASLLVANGVDSEPALSLDDALMREKTPEILEGLHICQALLKPASIVFALGEQSEDLAGELQRVVQRIGLELGITFLPSRYPHGHEELVLDAIRGRASAGEQATVLNVATLFAIYEAVVLDKPLIERVLTVTGSAVAQPRNLKARFGTSIRDLLEECGGFASTRRGGFASTRRGGFASTRRGGFASTRRGGFASTPLKVVMGGPMRGVSVDSLDLPMTKGTSGVVVFRAADAAPGPELPCIRCGHCIDACPWDLVPTRLYKLIRSGETEAAQREGLARCTECGCCAYACPSRIPLVAVLRNGKHRVPAGGNGDPHG